MRKHISYDAAYCLLPRWIFAIQLLRRLIPTMSLAALPVFCPTPPSVGDFNDESLLLA
jgi:hypothetical protein